jgi:thymidine kinase
LGFTSPFVIGWIGGVKLLSDHQESFKRELLVELKHFGMDQKLTTHSEHHPTFEEAVQQLFETMIWQSWHDQPAQYVFLYGPATSGKSAVAIEVIGQLRQAGITVAVGQPNVKRCDVEPSLLVSRNGLTVPCLPFASVADIEQLCRETAVVIIDEMQFTPAALHQPLLAKLDEAHRRGVAVLVTGLLYTATRGVFPLSVAVKARATYHLELRAVCAVCGRRTAVYSQRLRNGRPDPQQAVVVPPSTAVSYEPRCPDCHVTG